MTTSRRQFLKAASIITGGTLLTGVASPAMESDSFKKTKLCAHLWVYASRFPPHWDATPVLDEVFTDLSYAGYEGVELMEPILRHNDAVQRLKDLARKYRIGVSGTSYGAPMWDRSRHASILRDVEGVTARLKAVGGATFGISVGDAGRKKTEAELDAQADLLKEILRTCRRHGITPNLHNHTYELRDELHDLRGTMTRVPDLKLGPDLNWLVRGGVDPVSFIETYGHRMSYMHLRDQGADGKWTEVLGEGVTDFAAIARALKQVNYKGPAAVELAFEGPPARPVRESWKLSRDFVKRVLGY